MRPRAPILAAAMAAAVAARADVQVRLADGTTLRAISARRSGDGFEVRVEAGTLRLPAARVLAITELADRPEPEADDEPRPEQDGPAAAAAAATRPAAPTASLVAAEAAALASSGRLAAAESLLRDSLVSDREPELLVALGEVLMRGGRFEEALAPLREARPVDAPLLRRRDAALARALSRLDRTEQALAALRETPDDAAGSVAALRASISSDAALRQAREVVESTHFVVQAPAGTPASAVRTLLEDLEGVHAAVAASLGAAPPERIVVILHPGEEFWEATGMGSAVGGLFDGKVRVPAGSLSPPSPRLAAVLRHEVAHAFVEALSAGRAGRHWHEGIAEHFEDGELPWPTERRLAEQFAADPSSWPPRAMDHATCRSRVEFLLREHGMTALREFLLALGRGASMDEALRRSTGMTEAELDLAWGRSLSEVRR